MPIGIGKNINEIMTDISEIKGLSDEITSSVVEVNTAINTYAQMMAVIDRIAMQINIISLNASIEAARAGVHGKAFSVVADEIRSLAHSSKKTVSETEVHAQRATGSIKIINETVDKITAEIEKAYENINEISETTKSSLIHEA